MATVVKTQARDTKGFEGAKGQGCPRHRQEDRAGRRGHSHIRVVRHQRPFYQHLSPRCPTWDPESQQSQGQLGDQPTGGS